MYYTVVDERYGGIYVYTGLNADKEEGLLEAAKIAFPQYKNLKVIEVKGEMPKLKPLTELPY